MKTIRSEIIIAASAEEVWSVLAAFHLYPEWNPFIRKVRGKIAVAERLWFKARIDGLPAIFFRATIWQLVPPVKLGWYAIFLKGIFEASHYFEIEELGSGMSRFILTSYIKPCKYNQNKGWPKNLGTTWQGFDIIILCHKERY